MTHLIVRDLERGADLDRAALTALRGGAARNLTFGQAGGNTGAGQDVSIPGGLLFASPVITTQLVFAFDTNILAAPIVNLKNVIDTTTLTGSILNQFGGKSAVPV